MVEMTQEFDDVLPTVDTFALEQKLEQLERRYARTRQTADAARMELTMLLMRGDSSTNVTRARNHLANCERRCDRARGELDELEARLARFA